MKNDPLPPNTIADLVYWKDLDDQNDKASGTTCHASHVAKFCQMKDSEMMCLAEEKHVTKEPPLRMLGNKPSTGWTVIHMMTTKSGEWQAPRPKAPCPKKYEKSRTTLGCPNIIDPTTPRMISLQMIQTHFRTDIRNWSQLAKNKSKELELKWYSDNEKGICPKRVHDTDASFDLQYPRQSPIIIVPHSLIKIDLKIVLEIPVSTMVQVAFQSSLAKKKIDIKGGIIDASYMENIIVMLQNNSDRPYKIESQEKIAQAIFLPLVKIPQLTLMNRKIQDQALLFEASPEIYSLADVANLYLLAKAHKHFKILIHNLTEDVIKIPKETLVSSISTDIQNSEKPQSIPNFAQLFLFCDITSQYADVFASENEFGCTNMMKHQIDMGDARLIKQ
ncbi:hypothetical protein G9A89_019704 [Geosiphon pyriformis]|nr:hypothetical protein G9A89_019704 [Geosiphon pyriformis]